jgi:hypothetical protein
MAETNERQIGDELDAIRKVAEALEPLGTDARRHVIDYVVQALGMTPSQVIAQQPTAAPSKEPVVEQVVAQGSASTPPTDIRSLKEQKHPRSANEMAALVAYYLSELASDDHQDSITTADVEKYFKQAAYPLPGRVDMTLQNAAGAGYFDKVGRGQWRLNPVGYNLVAHGLPASSDSSGGSAPRRGTPAKRAGKKAAPKKTSAKKAIAKKSPAKKSPAKKSTKSR